MLLAALPGPTHPCHPAWNLHHLPAFWLIEWQFMGGAFWTENEHTEVNCYWHDVPKRLQLKCPKMCGAVAILSTQVVCGLWFSSLPVASEIRARVGEGTFIVGAGLSPGPLFLSIMRPQQHGGGWKDEGIKAGSCKNRWLPFVKGEHSWRPNSHNSRQIFQQKLKQSKVNVFLEYNNLQILMCCFSFP